MNPFEVGFIVGLVVGVPAGLMATITYQWWLDRPRRLQMDDYTERLRALDRRIR